MKIETRTDREFSVNRISGRLDASTSPEFEKQLGDQISGGSLNVILDFSGLEYISSAGLRGILATAKRLKGSNGKLILCCLKGVVEEVVSLSGFSTFLPVHETVEQAIQKESASH